MPQPTREPTHPTLDFGRLVSLASDAEDALEALGEEVLTPELIEEIAEELGARESHVYAAAVSIGAPAIAADAETSSQPRIEVCVGQCQRWGAIEALDHLIDIRGRDDAPRFSIGVKTCLDACQHAAVVAIHTEDGTATIAAADPAKLDEALAEL
jgi:NADH:ubiquinone oxidoreductase subunit E